jgi:hypothetical protein
MTEVEVVTRLAKTGTATSAVGPPVTVDDSTHTLQVCWLANSDVERVDWAGPYVERLPFSVCDLSRLASGSAAVTDSHQREPISSQIGVVKRAWLEGGAGLATIQISDRAELAGLWNDIRNGVVRNLSLEAEVAGWTETAATKTTPRIRTAVAWKPLALSFVSVPADPGAVTRSQKSSAPWSRTTRRSSRFR